MVLFKRPFNVKSNSQLKSSDGKKLRCNIAQQLPQLTEEALNFILPNKDPISHMKILTHAGKNVTVYSVQKLPMLFEVEKIMYPTVYMLWNVPDLLYTFTTHPKVLSVITRGADLMMPGVVLPKAGSSQAYGNLQKGDRVAVNLTTNRAAVAVGVAASSSEDIYRTTQAVTHTTAMRGKCVEILHYYGDLLCSYGAKEAIPELGPVFNHELNQHQDISEQSAQIADCSNEFLEEIIRQPETIARNVSDKASNGSEAAVTCLQIGIKPAEDGLHSNLSMDDILNNCFLKSLLTMKKVELPILTCNFYKLHMIPSSPTGMDLDIKKTSYKKLSTFLDEMAKLGVVKVECLQKGVQSITNINYNNELLNKFVDIFNGERETLCQKPVKSKNIELPSPKIIEKYNVTAATLPLFSVYGYKKKSALTTSEVWKVVEDYVRSRSLQSSASKREVMLDDVLQRAANSPSHVDVLPWKHLMEGVFGQMGHSYEVALCGDPRNKVENQGKLQPVDIRVATRSGNKKVTLVNNLELFGINLAQFSKECQHGAAASTTINRLPVGRSAQLQIQGNQVAFVAKLLMEKYQIPKRHLNYYESKKKF